MLAETSHIVLQLFLLMLSVIYLLNDKISKKITFSNFLLTIFILFYFPILMQIQGVFGAISIYSKIVLLFMMVYLGLKKPELSLVLLAVGMIIIYFVSIDGNIITKRNPFPFISLVILLFFLNIEKNIKYICVFFVLFLFILQSYYLQIRVQQIVSLIFCSYFIMSIMNLKFPSKVIFILSVYIPLFYVVILIIGWYFSFGFVNNNDSSDVTRALMIIELFDLNIQNIFLGQNHYDYSLNVYETTTSIGFRTYTHGSYIDPHNYFAFIYMYFGVLGVFFVIYFLKKMRILLNIKNTFNQFAFIFLYFYCIGIMMATPSDTLSRLTVLLILVSTYSISKKSMHPAFIK